MIKYHLLNIALFPSFARVYILQLIDKTSLDSQQNL